MPGCLNSLLLWSAKKWAVAVVAAGLTFLAIAIPTAMIRNPIFGRAIEVTSWSWPVLLITSALAGLLVGTYVSVNPTKAEERPLRFGAAGSMLGFLAVGCPVCNKIALIALGSSGALNYFAPIQPYLAVLGVALLAYALRARLQGEANCVLPKTNMQVSNSLTRSSDGNN
jgi:hypothetical protein